LYNTYMLICIVYLWAMLTERDLMVKIMAVVAVVWAIAVHSGTGAIFGFSPRELYQSALLPPSFISAALSSGTAMMILVILGLFKATGRSLDKDLIVRLGLLLGVVVCVVMYFIFVENAYRWYLAESTHASLYFLFDGVNAVVFWGGMILIGSIAPICVLFNPKTRKSIPWIVLASVLVVFGVLCERFLIVIPGLTNPPHLLPGMEIIDSPIAEGAVTYYVSIYEGFQALAVVGIIGFLFVVGLRFLHLLPSETQAADQTSTAKVPATSS